MGKYLRDLDLRVSTNAEERARWGTSTNFLEILYFNCLPRVQTNGVGKVIVEACKTLPPRKMEVMLDILQINKLFDFEAYFAAGKEIRKRIALEFLQDGILEIATIRGWDTNPFHQAYKTVLAKNFVNYLPWSKSITSPDRRHKAQVWAEYDSDKADIFLVIFHRKEIVSKTFVVSVQAGGVFIRGAIGKLEWLSPEKVVLTPREGKNSWEARYDNVQINVPTKPLQRSKAG
jgi:hypothetical protein